MKRLSCLGLWCLTFVLVVGADSFGQQTVPGAGPPDPSTALPAEQQALQGHSKGLSGPAGQPHPAAGAQNPTIDRNALSGINANSQVSPAQPIYEGSAAVGGQPRSVAQTGQVPPAGGPRAGTAEQRGQLGVWLIESAGPGVRIGRITSGSAADRGGLRNGDIILEVNGRGASSPETAARIIRAIPAGQSADLIVWRDGQQRQAEIVMEPAREEYTVAYRGENDSVGGDLHARLSKLEQRLAAVTEELHQLHQQMSQFHEAGSASMPPGGSQEPGATPGAADGSAVPDSGSTTQPSNGSTTGSSPVHQDQASPAAGTTTPGAGSTGTADDLFGPSGSNSNQSK